MITVKRSEFKREIIPDEMTEYDEEPASPDEGEKVAQMLAARERNYNLGHWGYVGIQASVQISIPYRQGSITHKISSPGLWGIESDSDDSYFNEVFAEESETLIDMLTQLGVKIE